MALADAVTAGALGRLTSSGPTASRCSHPLAAGAALESAGFHATPRGLRLRP